MATPEMEAPELVSSEEIYRGRIFDVTVDTVREGGQTYKREIVHHPGSAAIVAVFDDMTVALVRQYRHAVVRYLLEIPAGTLASPERPEEGAARELEEELGVTAARLEKLSEFFVSPGFVEEKMWVYLATDLTETAQRLEEDEMIEIVRVPFTRALEMVASGEIEDAKTIIGLAAAAARLGITSSDLEYPAG
jgi:ADP-ribose pyrophosphatase